MAFRSRVQTVLIRWAAIAVGVWLGFPSCASANSANVQPEAGRSKEAQAAQPRPTPAVVQSSAPGKPNVVFILADNVGYGDLGAYGGGELRGAPTPRLDALAQEGLRLTQFLVEPACIPSRAALMTGQYSIRSGLSLIAIEGSPYTLPANAFTMGELFKSVGYATAIFGKWHLGGAPQSLPTAHGFDEFYGIPPDISWDAATYPTTIALTHSINEPYEALLRT